MSVTSINYTRAGGGEPLLLIHGIGSRLGIWDPMLPLLTPHFDVVALDLPGFGGSPKLGDDVSPTPQRLGEEVIALMDELGFDRGHLAGNSLGGHVSFEIAKMGRALSVTALSPGGLFEKAPRSVKLQLALSYDSAKRFSKHADGLMRSPLRRKLLLGAMYGQPALLPAANAAADMRGLAGSTDFVRVREAIGSLDARTVTVPSTVAFGTKDLLLNKWQCQDRARLPAQHRWAPLAGCGHVPTWDDPVACARADHRDGRPGPGGLRLIVNGGGPTHVPSGRVEPTAPPGYRRAARPAGRHGRRA